MWFLAGAKILDSLSSCRIEHNVLFRGRPLREQLLHSIAMFSEHAVHLEIDLFFSLILSCSLNAFASVLYSLVLTVGVKRQHKNYTVGDKQLTTFSQLPFV